MALFILHRQYRCHYVEEILLIDIYAGGVHHSCIGDDAQHRLICIPSTLTWPPTTRSVPVAELVPPGDRRTHSYSPAWSNSTGLKMSRPCESIDVRRGRFGKVLLYQETTSSGRGDPVQHVRVRVCWLTVAEGSDADMKTSPGGDSSKGMIGSGSSSTARDKGNRTIYQTSYYMSYSLSNFNFLSSRNDSCLFIRFFRKLYESHP